MAGRAESRSLRSVASAAASLDAAGVSRVWLAIMVAAVTGFSLVFACAPPFAAFGAIAAMTLSRRDAVGVTIALWLANQLIGFGLLGYPWTANSVGWGVAMGVVAVVSTLVAQRIVARLGDASALVQGVLALIGSFAIYELLLIAGSLAWLGGLESYAPAIVARIFAVNCLALAGLALLHRVAALAGLVGPQLLTARPTASAQ